jgi:N-acyl homoserine lactone hydrolase
MPLSVYPLDFGELQLDFSFLVWQTRCGEVVWAPAFAWLIIGLDKPLLVDTGFRSVEDARAMQGLVARRSSSQTVGAQLARHGLEAADIGYIVHTHLHMDHSGQDHLFANARIFVQRKELQNAAAPNIFPRPFYDHLNIARLIFELKDRVEILDGEQELFSGMRLVDMPGHTPGHQAIYVTTNSGLTIIAGDAAMRVKENVRKGIIPGFFDNMSDTMIGLRRLAREKAQILASHDADAYQTASVGVDERS